MSEPKSPEHRTSPADREASAPLPPERSGRRPLIRVDVDREALAAFDKRAIAAQLGVGIVAGWLASWVVCGSGLLRYALTGFVGAFLLEKLGVDLVLKSPLANRIATATIAAAVVVVVARLPA